MAQPDSPFDRMVLDPLEHHLARDVIVNILNGKALYLFGNVYHNGVPFFGASEDIRAHGAVDGGLVDNSSALLDTVLTANGKVPVFIPDGRWGISAEWAPAIANTVLQGNPGGTSELFVMNGASNRAIKIQDIPGIKLRDLKINMNKANTPNAGQHAVLVSATNSTGCPGFEMERVVIINSWGRGLSAVAVALDTNPLDVLMRRCDISGCGGTGAFINNHQALTAEINNIHDGLLWGMQVVGGKFTRVVGNRIHDHVGGVNRGHGLVCNTAGQLTIVSQNFFWNNQSLNSWGAVLGINSTLFLVSDNFAWMNAGGMTMDVASDVGPNPIFVASGVHNNNTSYNTVSDGLHVNQCDDLLITGHVSAWNEQDGISVYGRNANVQGFLTCFNGRDGINFEEDLSGVLATCGPHRAVGWSHSNNRNAGTWKDYYSALLTNGPVLWDVDMIGSPEGVLRGGRGSTVRNKGGGAGTCFFVKENGVDNTGWVGK